MYFFDVVPGHVTQPGQLTGCGLIADFSCVGRSEIPTDHVPSSTDMSATVPGTYLAPYETMNFPIGTRPCLEPTTVDVPLVSSVSNAFPNSAMPTSTASTSLLNFFKKRSHCYMYT